MKGLFQLVIGVSLPAKSTQTSLRENGLPECVDIVHLPSNTFPSVSEGYVSIGE